MNMDVPRLMRESSTSNIHMKEIYDGNFFFCLVLRKMFFLC